jgi:SAM-dependent methyltransferase
MPTEPINRPRISSDFVEPVWTSADACDGDFGEDDVFDRYVAEYEAALGRGLAATGEGPEFFASKRIEWTKKLLDRVGAATDNVLDFGCGVGIAAPLLRKIIRPRMIYGFDPCRPAVERASQEFGDECTLFFHRASELPLAQVDVAYCNGVFHHIAPEQRPSALRTVWQSLRPGGWFAFWENNPWNPGTRFVMRRIPFDRDAQTMTPIESRKLLRVHDFAVKRCDAWFLFPRQLQWLRPLENLVHWLPLGAQYLVFAQKPTVPYSIDIASCHH